MVDGDLKTHGSFYLCSQNHHEVTMLRDVAGIASQYLVRSLVRAGALPELEPPPPPKSEVN